MSKAQDIYARGTNLRSAYFSFSFFSNFASYAPVHFVLLVPFWLKMRAVDLIGFNSTDLVQQPEVQHCKLQPLSFCTKAVRSPEVLPKTRQQERRSFGKEGDTRFWLLPCLVTKSRQSRQTLRNTCVLHKPLIEVQSTHACLDCCAYLKRAWNGMCRDGMACAWMKQAWNGMCKHGMACAGMEWHVQGMACAGMLLQRNIYMPITCIHEMCLRRRQDTWAQRASSFQAARVCHPRAPPRHVCAVGPHPSQAKPSLDQQFPAAKPHLMHRARAPHPQLWDLQKLLCPEASDHPRPQPEMQPQLAGTRPLGLPHSLQHAQQRHHQLAAAGGFAPKTWPPACPQIPGSAGASKPWGRADPGQRMGAQAGKCGCTGG